MKKNHFFSIFLLYFTYQWLSSFSKSIIPAYLFQNHILISQMVLSNAILFASQTILLIFIKKLYSKISYILAIAATLLGLLVIVPLYHPLQIQLMGIFYGFALFLFFLPYNIAYFRYSPPEKTGQRAALMFSIAPIIGIIAPLLAGRLAELSMQYIVIGSIISVIISLLFLIRTPDLAFSINITKSWNKIYRLRIMLLSEGFWEAFIIAVVPVISLYFFPKPASYGLYLSYLSIISVAANMVLGTVSDKINKRRRFLLPITMVLIASTAVIPFMLGSVFHWIIITTVIQFCLPIFWNFSTAIFVDNYRRYLTLAFPGREVSLSIGRFLGVSVAYIFFLSTNQLDALFWIFALALFGFLLSVVKLGRIRI